MPTTHLFTPIVVRDLEIRNRVWVAPMCQYSAGEDGVATDWHLMHLGQFAAGGAGLVMAEATAVTPEGRISPQDLGLWNDEQRDRLARIVALIRSQGAAAGIQLAHAGRKASTYSPQASEQGSIPVDQGGWQTLAPSPLAFEGYAPPREMTVDEIAATVDDFRAAARKAVDAGFDVLEVHAAHGYLIHEFLSPLSNHRTDAYGGSLENRARFLLEIVAAIRDETPEAPLFIRFSGTDWTDGGLDVGHVATVAGWARDAGADFFDISSGGNVAGASIPVGPGYQVPLAAHIRRHANVPVSAVGLITSPDQAEEILASGRADAVMLAREFLRDPHFPLRAAAALGEEVDHWPAQYSRARLAS